eukprot:3415359-Rhodomonas_salina.2
MEVAPAPRAPRSLISTDSLSLRPLIATDSLPLRPGRRGSAAMPSPVLTVRALRPGAQPHLRQPAFQAQGGDARAGSEHPAQDIVRRRAY